MEEIKLKWTKIIPQKESCFTFFYPGIYLLFWKYDAHNYRLVYVGKAVNISRRQYQYVSTYLDPNNLTDYSYYNTKLIKNEDPKIYLSNGNYNKSVEEKIIIEGNKLLPDATEEEIFKIRAENVERSYLSCAKLESINLLESTESVIQKYFIKKFSLDPYYNNCYPIGYLGRHKLKQEYFIKNNLEDIDVESIECFPQVIEDYDFQ